MFKLNIYHTINLMFRVKNNIIPEAFLTEISNSTTKLRDKTQGK